MADNGFEKKKNAICFLCLLLAGSVSKAWRSSLSWNTRRFNNLCLSPPTVLFPFLFFLHHRVYPLVEILVML